MTHRQRAGPRPPGDADPRALLWASVAALAIVEAALGVALVHA